MKTKFLRFLENPLEFEMLLVDDSSPQLFNDEKEICMKISQHIFL